MRKMKKWMKAAILICGTAMVFTSCSSNDDNPIPPTNEEAKTPDYSNKDNWMKLPEPTKPYDTFISIRQYSMITAKAHPSYVI